MQSDQNDGTKLITLPQFKLGEAVVVLVSFGLFIGIVVRTWGDFFSIHGIAIAAVLISLTSLPLLLILRQHRADRGSR